MTSPSIEARPEAPAYATADIDIAAPPSVVWEVMSTVDEWPKWNPDIKSAELHGPLVPGATITWKSGPGTIRSVVGDVEPESRLSWTGRSFGIRAIHLWKIEPLDGGVRVRTEESWDGLLPRVLRAYSRRTVRAALSSGLEHLKAEAERRARSLT